MNIMISHIFLQNYWWVIVSLLAALLVFLMFVQGGQTFLFSISSDSLKRKMIVNTLGRKWEFTFTTLVVFGGAFFASFPLFYATSFGGAYWVWMAILFSFIIQAIAYEYRSKPGNVYGTNTFDTFLFLNGSLGPLLIGTAVGTMFTGAMFTLDNMNRVEWNTAWRGLEAVTDIRNLALGFAVLFLARVNGLLYIILTVDDDEIRVVSRRKLVFNSLVFLTFFLYFVVSILIADGFAFNPADGAVFTEKYKYLHNLLAMPLVLVLFLAGVVGVLWGIAATLFRGSLNGIWFSGAGTVLAVLALFLVLGFNNTAFYPSLSDLQSSLTVRSASSSQYTLKTMMYVSFLIPFVLAYIWYAWKSITSKPVTGEEMKSDDHTY
jgi:cytochrome d ubiquinol oxidase subunit II